MFSVLFLTNRREEVSLNSPSRQSMKVMHPEILTDNKSVHMSEGSIRPFSDPNNTSQVAAASTNAPLDQDFELMLKLKRFKQVLIRSPCARRKA